MTLVIIQSVLLFNKSQYHPVCLGLDPSDMEGVNKWSCPPCGRKRKLQLTPPKSPKKRQKVDSPNSRSSSQNNIIASLPRPLEMTMMEVTGVEE
mmetsp:Transcript_25888/g.55667  ORF Transcript_25888/g.55667 Transcript_25888/m.55667 type:complete len:94 (+) Transcript_25888:72-353(+)